MINSKRESYLVKVDDPLGCQCQTNCAIAIDELIQWVIAVNVGIRLAALV